jgi:hypothetical protein
MKLIKHLHLFLSLALLLLMHTPSRAVVYHISEADTDPGSSTVVSGSFLHGLPPMAMADFLNLTPFKYKKFTGRNMGLKAYLILLVAQQEYRTAIKKGVTLPREIDLDLEKVKFHWGAFFLGLLFGLLSLIIGFIFDGGFLLLLLVSLIGLAGFIVFTVTSREKRFKQGLLLGYLTGIGITVLFLVIYFMVYAFENIFICLLGGC